MPGWRAPARRLSPASVLVIDVRPGAADPFRPLVPGRTTRTVTGLPGRDDVEPGTIAVGLHAAGEADWSTAFAEWAVAAGAPLLEVAVDAGRTLIGPLTVPGVVGCGHCARDRMLAAGTGGQRDRDAGPATLGTGVLERVTSHLGAISPQQPPASALVGHVEVFDPHLGSATRHHVVPLAHCRVCGGAAAVAEAAAATGDPLAGWVDRVTGVIPALLLEPDAPDRPHLPFVATAAPPHVVRPDGTLHALPAGWGKGMSASAAVIGAIGEAIERYSASVPDPRRIVWGRPDELAGERLDPLELALYTDEQYDRDDFPYPRFDPAVPHPWVRGQWLDSGREVWVPAVTAFLSLTLGPENLFCQGTSNGLAASTDAEDAARRATLELVERDAMMACWLTGAPGRRLALDDALDPALTAVVEDIAGLGCAVEIYLLPAAAGATAAVGLALGDGRTWPGVTVGMAAAFDPAAAVRGAILELGQTGPHLSGLMRTGRLPAPAGPQDVRGMLDHAAYYFPADRAGAFDRLRSDPEPVSLASLPAVSHDGTLAAALAGAGVRVAIVDVTSADVALSPFRVVRAVSPDLQPISFGHGLERAPIGRLRVRAAAAGGAGPIHPIA